MSKLYLPYSNSVYKTYVLSYNVNAQKIIDIIIDIVDINIKFIFWVVLKVDSYFDQKTPKLGLIYFKKLSILTIW